jgi:hypothetical protein
MPPSVLAGGGGRTMDSAPAGTAPKSGAARRTAKTALAVTWNIRKRGKKERHSDNTIKTTFQIKTKIFVVIVNQNKRPKVRIAKKQAICAL